MSFYRTTLKFIGSGSAVDAEGKHLIFIGNLPAKEGDVVWTDGRVIFGNVTPKSTPLILNTPGKIPVLAKNVSGIYSFVKRGYINQNGYFKDFDIVNDDWITNDKNNFKHGANYIGEQKVIDAEISSDSDCALLTATDGFYRKNKLVTFKNHLYINYFMATSGHPEQQSGGSMALTHAVFYNVVAYEGDEISLGVDENFDSDDNINFYRDGTKINSVNLKQFADLAKEAALEVQNKIMQESNKEEDAINFTRQPDPPENFIASVYARVATLHLSKNGDWDAVIVTSAYGYCFPYLTFDGSLFPAAFPNGENEIYSEDLVECMNNFENAVFESQRLPFTPNFSKYPSYESGNYSNYILDKAAYYIPRARFRYYFWFTMLFSATQILRVHNGNVTDTIYKNSGGGYSFQEINFEWNESRPFQRTYSQFVIPDDEKIKNWNFPLDDEFYFEAENFNLKTIYKKTKEGVTKIIDVSDTANDFINQNFYSAYFIYPITTTTITDETAQNLASRLGYNIEKIYGSEIQTPRLYYRFIEQNDTSYIYDQYPKNENYKFLSGCFAYDENQDDLRISHCFAKLKGNCYLGVRDSSLIKIDAQGGISEIIYGLKNFRLAELKNLSKTKI